MKVAVVCGVNAFMSKDGKEPVYIRINVGEKRKWIKVGVRVLKSQWDAKSKRVKNHPDQTGINIKIINMLAEVEANHLNDDIADVGDKKNFYWWFKERLDYSEKKHGYYNWKKLNSVYNALLKYAPKLSVKNVNGKFIRDFELHLLNKGNHPNTVADKLMRVKIIVREIVNSGGMKYHENPFLNHRIRFKKRERERITFEQLKQLEGVKIEKSATKTCRDMYVFSFYCGGMRFGDLVRLKVSNMNEGRLIYTMNKGRNQRSVKMHEAAVAIFNQYTSGKKESDRLFEADIYWPDEEAQISAKNIIMNRHLKDACELAGIPKITFHTARHSVADLAIRKKINIRDLKDILGHTKIETTEIYMKSFYQEETDGAMSRLYE